MKVDFTADQLVKDNLECIFKSDATDVTKKRKQTDWQSEYVNDYLIGRGTSDAHREQFADSGSLNGGVPNSPFNWVARCSTIIVG